MGLRQPSVWVAPDARAVLGDREIEARRRKRHVLRARLDEWEGKTVLRLAPTGLSSCAGVTSTPTGLAPRRASQAETYAVPQPSSTTSRPSTSPRLPREASGTPKTPHVISLPATTPRAPGRRCSPRSPSSSRRGCAGRRPRGRSHRDRSERESAAGVRARVEPSSARRRRARSGVRRARRGRRAGARAALSRVGAVHHVLREERREVAADRSGAESAGFVAPISPRTPTIASSPRTAKREHGPRGDEVDEVGEERLATVLRVVIPRERLRDPEEARGSEVVAALLEARDDLAAEAAPDAVRLHEHERGLDRHGGEL